eukprot:CAMPEP_0115004378 /NCGR_PEP_ID=MMETSP0216-20121206/19160_1 /TAXON_ID=223996 /ORGANISM="Protocruzia adherens, Strain Boccale" /LENGTH=109 /DNA_ID=CAMNT_0002370341 /DNA_START=88 /DNA_END=420 /DNA_ORIENTATION=-
MEVKTSVRKQSLSGGAPKAGRVHPKRRQTTAAVYGRKGSDDSHASFSSIKRLERDLKAVREDFDDFKWQAEQKEGKSQNVLFQEEKKLKEMQEDIRVKEELLIAMKLNL